MPGPDLDIVGTAAVDVIPIAPHFHQKLKLAVLPAADRVGEEAGRRIGEAIGRQIQTAIPSAITTGGNAARNAATRAGNDNGGAFARSFKNRLEVAFRSLPRPDVRLSTTGFDSDLARVRARLETLSNKRIGVDIDAATALAEMQAIDAKLAELGGRSPNIQVRADIATARAELAAMQRLVDDLDRDDVNIKVRANTSQANAAILQLAVSLGLVAAIPLVPIAGAAIGALASAATVAAAGVGAVALAAIPAIKGVTSVIQAKTAAEKEAASATDNSAAASVRAAQSALQMQTAQQALAAAHRNAARSIADADRQVENAERALGQAAARAMEQREQAAENVERAERSLADAKRDAQSAEEALTQARKDAAQQLEDLNDRLISGDLDQRDAALRVQEAYEELQATLADPTATDLQRQRAQLAYDEAVQAQKEQQKEYKRLQDEAKAAQKAGVEGNEGVKSAAERLAEAQQDVVGQTEAVADAHRDAARTQVEAAQSVADAQRNLSDAVTNAAETQVQAAESIASAERGVESARLSGIDTTAKVASKTDEYREALAKLTPEQRALYESLAGRSGLIAAYKEWSKQLQPDVLPLFTRAVDGAKNSLPGLTPLVKNSADAIGELMDRASADLKEPFWQRFKKGIAENAKPAIVGLGVSFGNVFKGMAGVIDAFFPHMDSISERMQNITGRFADWGTNLRGSPEFEEFLQYVKDTSPEVAEFLGDLLEAALDVAKALSPASEAAMAVLSPLLDGISWVSEHAPWMIQLLWGIYAVNKAIQVGMVAFAVAMGIYQVAVAGATLVTSGWAAALAATGIVPLIQAIVLGVALLAAGIIWAYKNVDWFREAVDATWSFIKDATIFLWESVLKPTFEAIWWAIKKVGDIAVWLWENAISPAFSFIWTAGRILAAILITLVITPIWLAIQGLGLIAGWLWEDCFKPSFDAIAWLATWLWEQVLSPVFGCLWDGIKWVGDQFVWLYGHAVKPSADWIAEKSVWLWETILSPTFQFIWDGLKWLGDKFKWLYDHAVRPASNWIADKAGWLYDKALRPAFDKMKSAVALVGDAFEDAKDAIKSAWYEVAGITSKPVNFVIEWVYTKGIKAVWDSVAGFVGLDKLPNAPKLLDETPKFADGGRTSGGIPGKDSIPALLMADEFVIKRDSARKIGFGALEYINRTGELPGVQRFADGGIVGAVGSAWDFAKDVVSTGADFLANPSKIWDKLIRPVLDKVAGGLGDAPIGKTLAKYPSKMAGGLRDMLVEAATGFLGGGGGSANLGNGQWARPVNAPFGTRFGVAGPMWSSGHHTGLDFPAPTGTPIRAVDRGKVVGATSGGPYGRHILVDHGDGLASLYAHLSRMAAFVGQAVTRGQIIGAVGATGNTTGPHLHLEARMGGKSVDPMPFLYDDGGYLQPGMNLVANGTGRPEPVLTSQQWADIRATRGSTSMPNIIVENHTYLGTDEITDILDHRIEIRDAATARDIDNGRWV
ncbi:peptidoglycan DD-metalloendopeptidase family protein [Streptomyces sp. NPDC057806]|uniref:peptidoglycan DD-metalloendopeptidase family protein n=1 Tax=Streptomyces sp. NPDC057806 TaxID=3346255 RepID=UPI0036B99CEF